ncbi:death-associated protein 1 isoform X1 [Strigops habroptila]|uniref:death-associated protein 1 isoform X1 n=1 Tax=Strigops habroptila TaxID=2489341 RepID=UPI0011CEFD36|nr:death-associated protein 1 isoform X1 [Strigops habroptila]
MPKKKKIRMTKTGKPAESTGACQREILKVLRMGKRKRDTSQFVEHGRQTAVNSPPKPTVFISGVIARGDKDFPPAAAQVAHQKPHPSVEKLPPPQHVKQHIHQPRK